MPSALIVSPHRDDAAFSCSIAIRHLVKHCSVTALNCCTRSEYAPFRIDTDCAVSDLRLQEDLRFADICKILLQDLDLVDAPQRLSIPLAEICNKRPFSTVDSAPRDEIAAGVISQRPDLIFVPLALGNHIDHRIAQAAALQTGLPRLAFYEDLPYASRISFEAAEQRAHQISSQLIPWFFRADDASAWKARCAAIYASQIDSATVNEIADYTKRYNGGERFWVTPAAAEWLQEIVANQS